MNTSNIDFDYIRKIVREYSAVALDADKKYLAELHLAPLSQLAKVDSIAELIALLRTQPFNTLHIQAIEALVTYETSFFRDMSPFETLKNYVLPQLLQHRAKQQTLNIWCAACSSGQEPYSIAILIRENFPSLASWTVRLIASDFSSKILARANLGRYTQLEIKRGLPEALKEKYFEKQGHHWQIQKEIQQMVEFRQLNLIGTWSSLPQMDIIFLRNILIYFDVETKRNILSKVGQLLKPDGYLFLGSGETTLNLDTDFERVQFDKNLCYRLRSS